MNAAGTVTLNNDTISQNRSTAAGGGVASVAGVLQTLGVVNLRNTIIAQNNDLLATNLLGRDVFGAAVRSFRSRGNNLIGSNFGAEVSFTANVQVGVTPTPDANGDIIGGVSAGNTLVDPLLGNLQNNGGATNTRLAFRGQSGD